MMGEVIPTLCITTGECGISGRTRLRHRIRITLLLGIKFVHFMPKFGEIRLKHSLFIISEKKDK